MLQIKIQEKGSYRFMNSKYARFNQSRKRLDQSRYISAEFNFGPTAHQAH